MKSKISAHKAQHREAMIRAKARRKAALIHERASERPPQKSWKWQRATPRAS